MESQKLDIVELIEHNPITKLSKNYQGKFIEKIHQNFTETQQQLYIASLYTFLNYNSKTDFVIELEHIWKWLGYSRIDPAKVVLEKHFILDTDYKIGFPEVAGKLKDGINIGGRPKEKILMTINTFKKLCLKSNTTKADEIHDYYIKLKEITQEIIIEESAEKEKQYKIELQQQKDIIEELENKPETEGFIRKSGYVYVIENLDKLGHKKIGYYGTTNKADHRLSQLNVGSSTKSLRMVCKFKTYDIDFLENLIHHSLQPFKIKDRKEWFYIKNDFELAYTINIITKCIKFIDDFNIIDYNELKLLNKNLNIKNELEIITKYVSENKNITENIEQNKIQLKDEKIIYGKFKGVTYIEVRKKWRSNLVKNKKNIHLGYFDEVIDAAKAYNDYALFMNETNKCNYLLNDIPDYIPIARNIPEENKAIHEESNTSKYLGVSYIKSRKSYCASITVNSISKSICSGKTELEAAKAYNQQALFYNNTEKTEYKLNDIPDYITESKDIITENRNIKKAKKTSKYIGVMWNKDLAQYKSVLNFNKKLLYLGVFNLELEAAKVYNQMAAYLNENKNRKYKINDIPDYITIPKDVFTEKQKKKIITI